MNTKAIISLATVSTVLAVGVAALEAVTIGTTHSANPANMKIRSDFNNLKLSENELITPNFKNVKTFVCGNGRGTLIAKKTDKNDFLEFKYYEHGETIDVVKNDIVCSDWQAVRAYMKQYDKSDKSVLGKSDTENQTSEVTKHKKTSGVVENDKEKNGTSSLNTQGNENVTGSNSKNTGTEMGKESELQLNDELKNVLKDFEMTEKDLDDVLHTFWAAKERYRKTPVYLKMGLPLETFHPSSTLKSFLDESDENNMRKLFFAEKHWRTWKPRLDLTIGKNKLPNPVAACYYWVAKCGGCDELSKELGLPSETVAANVRRFVEIFYRLTGADERVNQVQESSGSHVSNPSENW